MELSSTELGYIAEFYVVPSLKLLCECPRTLLWFCEGPRALKLNGEKNDSIAAVAFIPAIML